MNTYSVTFLLTPNLSNVSFLGTVEKDFDWLVNPSKYDIGSRVRLFSGSSPRENEPLGSSTH
jgi:hypothetical protein